MKFGSISAVALALLTNTVSASWGIKGASSGVDSNSGARPFRLPIEELQQSGPMWDLYIQVMQFWQSVPQDNMFSWYGVGGIHGLPQESWDGADGAGYYIGYCTHGSILFPVWHRPYMALHEQIISIFAHEIADTYPDAQKATYQQAADQLRMPYWDWTTNATMPDIVNQPKVTVNAAWGTETVDNPLYRYNYHPYDAVQLQNIYSNVNWTLREPNKSDQSEPAMANAALDQNQQQFHDGIYQLFSSQPDYKFFANTGVPNQGQGYQSLEALHNTIHNTVGGTMQLLWVAAMDPIFFLHHANVDRLFAMWQAIYPDSFVTPQANAQGTYVVAPNTVEDNNTALAPFHSDDNGTFYTANSARYTKDFGYAYREVVDWNVTADELTKNVKTNVNRIYNPNGSGVASKRGIKHKRDVSGQVDQKSATAAAQQYVLNVVADKSKINSTLLVHFMLRNQTFGSFAINIGSTDVNPASKFATPSLSAGQISLTHALLGYGANLADTNGTLAAIAKDVSWTGTLPGGQKVYPSDLTDGAISIQVSTRPVTQTAPEHEFPVYGDWNHLANTTLGNFASSLIGSLASDIENTIKNDGDDLLRRRHARAF